ncbi:MAG: BMP family ABC transporter substrate-binding protein [Oscillospiraceae bacterium]|nr:BMP family ABC transporter substrate-binding protein [Oscillospiraceae bacterium]
MKKKAIWVLILSLLLSCLGGCAGDSSPSFQFPSGATTEATTEPSTETIAELTEESTPSPAELFQVAIITDYYDITDQSFNQVTYEAGRDWCEEHNIPYSYYKPKADSTEARVLAIEQAIGEGANVLLLPGYAFAGAIVETAEKYPEVYYIALDVGEFDLQDAAGCADDLSYIYPKNIFSAVYQEEIAGFLAGYAVVKMGYRDLGFMGGLNIAAILRYAYGFIQGADHAAGELGVEASVKVAYGNQCFGELVGIEREVDKWFREGTEAVLLCGGGMYDCLADVEVPYELKIIGTDVDQKGIIDELYGSGTTLTSPLKNFSATIPWTLSKLILENDWDSLGGTVQTLGLVSGRELDKNHIALPDSTQWNDSFTREDYAAIIEALFTGAVTVDNCIDREPVTKYITAYHLGNVDMH